MNIQNNNYQTEINDLYPIDNLFNIKSSIEQKSFINNNKASWKLKDISNKYQKQINDYTKKQNKESCKKYFMKNRLKINARNRDQYYKKNRSIILKPYSKFLENKIEVLKHD